jgi:hypothetical protein
MQDVEKELTTLALGRPWWAEKRRQRRARIPSQHCGGFNTEPWWQCKAERHMRLQQISAAVAESYDDSDEDPDCVASIASLLMNLLQSQQVRHYAEVFACATMLSELCSSRPGVVEACGNEIARWCCQRLEAGFGANTEREAQLEYTLVSLIVSIAESGRNGRRALLRVPTPVVLARTCGHEVLGARALRLLRTLAAEACGSERQRSGGVAVADAPSAFASTLCDLVTVEGTPPETRAGAVRGLHALWLEPRRRAAVIATMIDESRRPLLTTALREQALSPEHEVTPSDSHSAQAAAECLLGAIAGAAATPAAASLEARCVEGCNPPRVCDHHKRSTSRSENNLSPTPSTASMLANAPAGACLGVRVGVQHEQQHVESTQS